MYALFHNISTIKIKLTWTILLKVIQFNFGYIILCFILKIFHYVQLHLLSCFTETLFTAQNTPISLRMGHKILNRVKENNFRALALSVTVSILENKFRGGFRVL